MGSSLLTGRWNEGCLSIGLGNPEFALGIPQLWFRWYRGQDSTGVQRRVECNDGLRADPVGVVAAVFRAGQRIATPSPALDSRLVWILAGDDLATKSDFRNRNSVETTCLSLTN